MLNRSKLFASLRVMGLRPDMKTFADRKRVQKIVYLLDKFVDMNFDFSYSWYLHGPYSPEVAKTVFDVIEGRQVQGSDSNTLSGEDQRKIEKLKSFLGNDVYSNDQLELLVSVHFLMQYLGKSGVTERDIIAFLKAKKPYFTDEEILKAINRLRL